MNTQDFRKYAHQLVDWAADYLENIESYPVLAPSKVGEVLEQIPAHAPDEGESFEQIFRDFQSIILPNMTHWQHPSFFAYFPANSSPPSVLAEILTATLAAQCMSWQTSPAATELEEKMMIWLKEFCQLPQSWHGVIQDTASTATLCALLTAREKRTDYKINETGFSFVRLMVYTSQQAHSSIEKAVKIAGLGAMNLRKIPTNEDLSVNVQVMEEAIKKDIKSGFLPLCIVANIGTTSTTAVDDVQALGLLSHKYNLWLHVDAAYAGSAAILPEKQHFFKGLYFADSYVFNPHKWLLTNFDCTAYFVHDKNALINTFSILPEYLKTQTDGQVNNYRDWGIQLGRRFRALKLWFVLRTYGKEKIRTILRNHNELAHFFAEKLQQNPLFEILAPINFNLVCFRCNPPNTTEEQKTAINQKLIQRLNSTGKVFLTHTQLGEKYVVRAVFGQISVAQKHVENLWEMITQNVKPILDEQGVAE